MPRQKSDLPKYVKLLPPGYFESAQSMSTEELNAEILKSSRRVQEVREELKENDKIRHLRDEVKELQGPFKDTIKALDAKIKCAHEVLARRGIPSA